MNEVEVTIPADPAQLAATLAFPAGASASALVVFVHGSGPVDRNGSLKGQRFDVFKAFAAGLAQRGIASLRFDKRGCGRSGGDYFASDLSRFRDDVIAAILFARREIAPPRLFLVGHSEGTLLSVLAQRQAPVDGLVLLMPFAENLEPLLMRQAEEIDRALSEWPGFTGFALRLTSALRGGAIASQRRFIRKAMSARPGSYPRGLDGVSVPSAREGLGLDVIACYAGISCPVLLVGGDKDVQCRPDDVRRLAALLGPGAEAHVLGDMTHILRRTADRPGLASYRSLFSLPVDRQLIDMVGDWLAAAS